MARRIGLLLIVAIAMMAFLYTAQAQTGEKKWKKTITLPNGDVVLDMTGEWDAALVYLRPGGPCSRIGKNEDNADGQFFCGYCNDGSLSFPKG